MLNKEVTKNIYSIFKDKLKNIGFKQLKPGKYFYKTDYGYITLELQKSQYSFLFYINLGIHVNGASGKNIIKEDNTNLFYGHTAFFRINDLEIIYNDILNFEDKIIDEQYYNSILSLIKNLVIPECEKIISTDLLIANSFDRSSLWHDTIYHSLLGKLGAKAMPHFYKSNDSSIFELNKKVKEYLDELLKQYNFKIFNDEIYYLDTEYGFIYYRFKKYKNYEIYFSSITCWITKETFSNEKVSSNASLGRITSFSPEMYANSDFQQKKFDVLNFENNLGLEKNFIRFQVFVDNTLIPMLRDLNSKQNLYESLLNIKHPINAWYRYIYNTNPRIGNIQLQRELIEELL
jgi:hypothetical protein